MFDRQLRRENFLERVSVGPGSVGDRFVVAVERGGVVVDRELLPAGGDTIVQ
jgi:hypothetical protein